MSMKSLLAGAGALVACTMLQPSAANAQFYVSGSAGYLQERDVDVTSGGTTGTFEFDPGFALNVAAGYKLPIGVRLEGELGYGRSSFDKLSVGAVSVAVNGDIDIFTATANAFYDFDTGTAFTPYLGGGIGIAHQSGGTVTIPAVGFTGNLGDSTDFVWMAEAGLSYALTKNVSVVPAYRFVQIQDGGSGSDDSSFHLFKIGLRYTF
jgi:opacity protein-like surface antigen